MLSRLRSKETEWICNEQMLSTENKTHDLSLTEKMREKAEVYEELCWNLHHMSQLPVSLKMSAWFQKASHRSIRRISFLSFL